MSRVRLSRPSTAASTKTLGGGKATQLSHDMQMQLKKLLLIISKGEKSIERQRQRLAKNEKFEPYAAFMRVDRDENGVIGSVEILRFLRENGVEEATEADCFLIVKYFDSDEDGYLNFQDFLQLILPCDNQALRSKVV
jgi:Ca2+-binding EF-hand superfamily protein